MQDGEGSHRGRKRVCVGTFARGELAPFHSVVIEHPRHEGEVFQWRGACIPSCIPFHVCNATKFQGGFNCEIVQHVW